MGINAYFFAVSPERVAELVAEPQMATLEARTRGALALLKSWRALQPDESEVDALTRIRSGQMSPQDADDDLRHWLTTLFELERRGLDAALARGDRETPFELGEAHVELDMILSEEPAFRRLAMGGEELGLDCGYGPARLHQPAAVVGISAALAGWDDARFLTAAAAAQIDADERASLARVFGLLRTYVSTAAASGSGLLSWIG